MRMVPFSSASSVEAEQAYVQSRRIILGALDRAVRPNHGVGAVLWNQNIAYNLLCRPTEQPWEGAALDGVSTMPTSTIIGSVTGCVNMPAGHGSGFFVTSLVLLETMLTTSRANR